MERRAAEARGLQASLRPNPELDVEVESLGGRGERSGFDAAEITISLGQLIELRGKRDKRIRVASLETELAEWDFESQRLDTLRDVTQAFVAVLAAQERLALAEQLRDLSGQAQSAVAQRVEAGKDSAVENLRADVVFSMSRIEFQKASRALTAARRNLAAVWGARTASFEAAAGDFYAVTPAPSALDTDELIAANPDLARWVIEQRQRQAALDLERARATSDITVAAGVQHFRESDDSAFMVGLALPIPLFDRNQGGIEEATANLAKARKQQQAAEIEIAAMLAEAVNGLAAAYDEAHILRADVLPRAQQAFEAAQQGYREGKFDYLYVLDTQRTFFETKVQYIDTVEACHRARADVERLTGRPLDPRPADDERQSKGAEQ
jgi:cobalt-zinc-cadmium efflux system outer membrane protein